jgi:hypothetical protein
MKTSKSFVILILAMLKCLLSFFYIAMAQALCEPRIWWHEKEVTYSMFQLLLLYSFFAAMDDTYHCMIGVADVVLLSGGC